MTDRTGTRAIRIQSIGLIAAAALACASPALAANDDPQPRAGQPEARTLLQKETTFLQPELSLFPPRPSSPRLPDVEPFPSRPLDTSTGELELRLQVDSAVVLFLTADLDQEMPRLDAVDGETYFSVGFEVSLTRSLRLFVEDFLPASGVVGEMELDAGSRRESSWDGHQLALGARLAVTDDVELRGELRAYLLSEAGRSDSLGGLLSLRWRF